MSEVKRTKRVWAHEFYEAYARSLEVKGKRVPKWEQKIIDMKHHERNAKPTYLWDWLVKNKYILPHEYKVFMRCGSCGRGFPAEKWDGIVKGDPEKSFTFICRKCARASSKQKATKT